MATMKKYFLFLFLTFFSLSCCSQTANSDVQKWYKLKMRVDSTVNLYQKRLLLVNPASMKGSEFYHDYFKCIRFALSLPYHLNMRSDEHQWNKYLADMMMYFYVCCDSLPDRTSEAYDNLIARKNFFAIQTCKTKGLAKDWKSIAQRLDDHEVAIEITDLKDELLFLKRGYSSPHSVEIDSLLAEEITKDLTDDPLAIDKLYIEDGPLRKLWMLMAPELHNIKTIYISGNFKYSQLNFAAIPIGNGQILSDRFDVHQMLSTTSIKKDSEALTRIKTAAVFGGIDYDFGQSNRPTTNNEPWNLVRGLPDSIRNGFGPLPGSKLEVAAIDSILASGHIQLRYLQGKQASEDEVHRLSGTAPDLLHFSTHGFMLAPLFTDSTIVKDYGDTVKYLTILSQSGLLFAGANKAWKGRTRYDNYDGILTSSELMKLNLSGCRLAVLSACRGALGEDRNLTGMPFGVAYALKDAGVSQVMCSLWSISDKATYVYMKHFYSHLMDNESPSEALRHTVNDMKKEGYKSPYYWASFILVE